MRGRQLPNLGNIRRELCERPYRPEFLQASWNAGVVLYEVDFAARTVSCYGPAGEEYVEAYPPVEV